jgi:hypothetical protein
MRNDIALEKGWTVAKVMQRFRTADKRPRQSKQGRSLASASSHCTAVDKVGVGKRRIVNTRFAAMASHYLFDPDFCNVASGWEKGVTDSVSALRRIGRGNRAADAGDEGMRPYAAHPHNGLPGTSAQQHSKPISIKTISPCSRE